LAKALLAANRELSDRLVLFRALTLQEHHLRHILDVMKDERDFTVFTEHRRIDRAPVALLEAATCRLGTRDVVLLNRHLVRPAIPNDTF
jgi:hypothetical protein